MAPLTTLNEQCPLLLSSDTAARARARSRARARVLASHLSRADRFRRASDFDMIGECRTFAKLTSTLSVTDALLALQTRC